MQSTGRSTADGTQPNPQKDPHGTGQPEGNASRHTDRLSSRRWGQSRIDASPGVHTACTCSVCGWCMRMGCGHGLRAHVGGSRGCVQGVCAQQLCMVCVPKGLLTKGVHRDATPVGPFSGPGFPGFLKLRALAHWAAPELHTPCLCPGPQGCMCVHSACACTPPCFSALQRLLAAACTQEEGPGLQ